MPKFEISKLLGADALLGEYPVEIEGCKKTVLATNIESAISDALFRVRLQNGSIVHVFGRYFCDIESRWYREELSSYWNA